MRVLPESPAIRKLPRKWSSVRIGDNSTGTRELTLSRPG
jgi:hypothetical protein